MEGRVSEAGAREGNCDGLLVLERRRAGKLCGELPRCGVMTDYRGDGLRLGPAPYLSDRQLRDAAGIFGETAKRPQS